MDSDVIIFFRISIKADFHEAKSSANSQRIRWRNLLSMRTFVCFDFTSEMRRNISARKSRNHFYFFVTKNFAKHFKPIRIRNFFRREFADDFASWKSTFIHKKPIFFRDFREKKFLFIRIFRFLHNILSERIQL